MPDTEEKVVIWNVVHLERKWFSFTYTFVYVDTRHYLADNILEKYQVRGRWLSEFSKPDDEYIVIGIKVFKPDLEKFLSAMEELQDKMLICGHLDYKDACKKIIDMIIGGIK